MQHSSLLPLPVLSVVYCVVWQCGVVWCGVVCVWCGVVCCAVWTMLGPKRKDPSLPPALEEALQSGETECGAQRLLCTRTPSIPIPPMHAPDHPPPPPPHIDNLPSPVQGTEASQSRSSRLPFIVE